MPTPKLCILADLGIPWNPDLGQSIRIRIISDTFGRPFRMGQTNCAIGISGLQPILDYSGTFDSFNRMLRVTAIAIADIIKVKSKRKAYIKINGTTGTIMSKFERKSYGST